MNRESRSVTFACLLGAFIGALSALEISVRFQHGSFLWVFGALFGGLIAWIIVDFRQLCTGVKCAYNQAINWKPNKQYWITSFTWSVLLLSITCSVWIITSPILYITGDIGEIYPMPKMGFVSLILFVSIICGPVLTLDEACRDLPQTRKRLWGMIKISNPVGLICFVLEGVWRLIVRIYHGLPTLWARAVKFVQTICKFVRTSFIYVHTEKRKLCFIDATIGASIGFFFGSAVIGAVAGAILGFVNYELVSVRWLKITPS